MSEIASADQIVDFTVLKRLEAYSSPEDNLIAALILDYEADSKKLLKSLTQYVLEKDVKGIHDSAHGLRSISECLGMQKVSSFCQRFEDATEINDVADADVQDLSKDIATALNMIKQYWSTQV